MDEKSFIYWLQGFMEIADPKSIDEKQIQIIKDHIALVLKKETPHRSLGSLLVPDSGGTKVFPLPPQTHSLPYTNPQLIVRQCPKNKHGAVFFNCGDSKCPVCTTNFAVTC